MLRSTVPVVVLACLSAIALALLAACPAHAQDELAEEPGAAGDAAPDPAPPAEPDRASSEEPEPAPEEVIAVPEPEPRYFEDPTPVVSEDEPSIEEYEETLAPTLVLPEFRIRIGGGVSLATSGPSGVWARLTQEVEWMPPSLQFLSFGLGVAEMIGVGVAAQVGLRVGGFAWFCEDAVVRCMGAITIQLGAIAGAIGPDFDFSADADLRFLFSRLIELHVRGGFFSVQMQSFVNITAGLGVAF